MSRMKIATRQKNGYTLLELLLGIFVAAVAATAYEIVRAKHGPGLAALAAALAVLAGVWLVVLFYRWSWRRDKRRLVELRAQYRTIYQIKELPADAKKIVKPEWAEIQIGDYGWDARPVRPDGLVHLQGLTERWQVVWHAAFRPEQIEKVAEKPASQYDYWVPYYWANHPTPPPCPFPVRDRNTPTMGLPHHSGRYFKDYPAEYYVSPTGIKSSQKPPVMTAAEFISWRKAPARQSLIWMFVLGAMVFGMSRLCFYMDRVRPALWIQVLAACAVFSTVALFIILPGRMAKLTAKKHGFQCPVCGNKITAFTGLAGRPYRQLCGRCGIKVIEFNEPNAVPKVVKSS